MMRDPDSPRPGFYEQRLESLGGRLARLSGDGGGNYGAEALLNIHYCTFEDVLRYMRCRHGRGDALADILAWFDGEGWPAYQRSVEFIRPKLAAQGRSDWVPNRLIVDEYAPRELCFFIAFLACMDPSPQRLNDYRNWLHVDMPCRLLDVLLKAFIPQYPGQPQYKTSQYREWWMTPLLAALAQPPEGRAAALAAHMNDWQRLMRPLGCKPLHRRDAHYFFGDFAFEVALAVCAYDVDDSAFRAHPHYPRDLVEHYRKHIRDTRDAWRAQGVGAGIALPQPAAPQRADLAQSGRKDFERWLELVCDGHEDAIASVLETVGKPAKVTDFYALLNALDAAGHAIHADWKDDDSLECQAIALADARGMGQFAAPHSEPMQGPDRSTALLAAFDAWSTPRGYNLSNLNDDDDAWHVVLVRAQHHKEFVALSRALGLCL